MTTFAQWLDAFIEEKGLDLEQTFKVEGPHGGPTGYRSGWPRHELKRDAFESVAGSGSGGR